MFPSGLFANEAMATDALRPKLATWITQADQTLGELQRTGCKDETIRVQAEELQKQIYDWLGTDWDPLVAANFRSAPPSPRIPVGAAAGHAHHYQTLRGRLDYLRGLAGRLDREVREEALRQYEARQPEPLPTAFGDWIVDRRLGSGAQGHTYAVHHRTRPGTFALKALAPWTSQSKQATEAEQRSRFFTEVSALKALEVAKCPRIVRVLDDNVEVDRNTPNQLWYVMPYYEAGPMRRSGTGTEPGEFLEKLRGNVERVLSIARDLAETLEAMHPDWVHRESRR